MAKGLSELEAAVWRVVTESDGCTADDVRRALDASRPLKDSTVRTVLRRLEAKGYVEHALEGRTYVYRKAVEAHGLATRAVQQIIERFCGGSVERLLVGMIDERVISREQLAELSRRVDAAEKKKR